MADIDVDISAIGRLEAAARGVSSRLSGLSPRVIAAGTLPGGTFGRMPFISDYLSGKYTALATQGAQLCANAETAFTGVGDGLRQTAEAYAHNEAQTGLGFANLQSRLPG